MSAFHVGQKVVCVDASPTKGGTVPPFRVGDVLTVAGFMSGDDVALVECPPVPSVLAWNCIGAWSKERFRPVAYPKQSLEHDVQTFLKIADRAPAPKKRASVKA